MKQLFKSNGINSGVELYSRELKFDELLKMNGGYCGGSSGKICSSSSLTNTSSSKKTSTRYKYTRAYASTSGSEKRGKYGEKLSIIDGRTYSGICGFIPEKVPKKAEEKTEPEITPENKTEEKPKKKEYTGLWSIPEEDAEDLINTVEDVIKGLAISKKKQKKIIQQINKDMQEGIVYGEDGFKCDNYVQRLLKDCEIDSSSYFAGDASRYEVKEHIANLKKSKKYDSSTVKNNGTYIVFMSGPCTDRFGVTHNLDAHCAIMTVDSKGQCYMTDNSSGNETGGLGITFGKNVSEVQTHFLYSNFYYQKVK